MSQQPFPPAKKSFMDQSPINRGFTYGCGCLAAVIILFWIIYAVGALHH